MLIDHSNKTIDEICSDEGRTLWGERLMYERIKRDCENDQYTWHMFYNLKLSLPVNDKADVEPDFLLICNKGAIIIEVKGGELEIKDGKFINHGNGGRRLLKESPFAQAESYKWAIFNNHVFNKNEIFISTMCAFPCSTLQRTSNDNKLDQSNRMWNKFNHDNDSLSFADFCINIIEADQQRKGWVRNDYTERELNAIISKFAPTIRLSRSYAERSLAEVQSWLKADNLDTLESLSKNQRIVIEGGPGTGKTTIAKAYIDKFAAQRGIYLCWNQLLAAKMKYLLQKRNLVNCDVERIESFLIKISDGKITPQHFRDRNLSSEFVRECLIQYKSSPIYPNYAYIVIDEIHDMLDIGALDILDCISSIDNNGLEEGRFLVFYDEKQGYDNQTRGLNNLISSISDHATIFTLTHNKRVPSNSDIVKVANTIRDLDTFKECKDILVSDLGANSPINVKYFTTPMELMKEISDLSHDICNKQVANEYVLLTHSNLNKVECIQNRSFYDVLRAMSFTIQELDENNVNERNANKVSWTSILRYKGLEKENVIIALKYEDFFNCYELYIGLTRAILTATLLILE